MHRSLLSAVLSLSVLLSTVVAAQDAEYTVTTIDVPFPGATSTFPSGINAASQIVGWFLDPPVHFHGFLATPVPAAASLAQRERSGWPPLYD